MDNDGFVSSNDVSLIINAINAGTGLTGTPFAYRDSTADNALTSFDALRVINVLSRPPTSGLGISGPI